MIWATLIALTHALVMNELTLRDRMKLISTVYRDDDCWMKRREVYMSVSYDKHLWHRMTFRDPFKLYPGIECD